MRNSLLTEGFRASVAGTLLLSLGLTPALAHMGGGGFGGSGARPGGFFFHGRAFGFHGFNRSALNHRFFFGHNRVARNGFKTSPFFNQGLLLGGCCGWGWGGGPWVGATSTGADPVIVSAGGPAVVINLSPPTSATGDAAPGYEGACVVHQLEFDSAGKYIGERQYPQC